MVVGVGEGQEILKFNPSEIAFSAIFERCCWPVFGIRKKKNSIVIHYTEFLSILDLYFHVIA